MLPAMPSSTSTVRADSLVQMPLFNVSANNLSTGQLETIIFNDAGIISGVAAVHGQISGDVVATGDIFFDILNNFQGQRPWDNWFGCNNHAQRSQHHN